ncbi:MAG: glycosyltransferase family 4 protein [Candidatus Magasanikiibacteriota bacterium]
MKVLHIIDSLGLGGAQTVVRGIFEAQRDDKDIFLFVLRKRDITVEIKHPNFVIFNSIKKYSFKPLFDLKDLIKKEKISILHCHLFRSQISGYLLKRIWFPDIKLLFHEHGEIFQGHNFYNLFIKLSKKYVDQYIAVSNVTKEKIVKIAKVLPTKIIVLPNFIDLKKFNKDNILWDVEEEKAKIGIKKEEFVIGFVGRLEQVKGCEYLIKALPLLNFAYKVLIVGQGSQKKILENLAVNLGISDKIIFVGYLKNVIMIYSLLDTLVVPSVSESFGLSVVEAQSMGVPVVASGSSGLVEIIKDNENGLLFKVQDPVDLAKKIKLVKDEVLLSDTILKNALESVKKYCFEKYLNNLNMIYENERT